jgi:GTP-binding protein
MASPQLQHSFYQQAKFTLGVPSLKDCPPDEGFEVAFAGRSNAGKSSALNAITQQNALARVSKTPGRTQAINFFAMNEQCRLVDLPGYGYAKVGGSMKDEWQKNMGDFVTHRQALKGLIILMDIRHPFTEMDVTMLNWARDMGKSVHLLLTKADKFKRGPAKNIFFAVQKRLNAEYPGFSLQLFSSQDKQGLEEVWAKLDAWMERV